MSATIELVGVHKNFGGTEVIRGVDLAVMEGQRHAVIGPNGAGKSTLYNLITGRHEITSGDILLRGNSLIGKTPFEVYRAGLARSFQITNIFQRMTVFENIRCGTLWSLGYGYKFWRLVDRERDLTQRTEEVLEKIGLSGKRQVPAGLLSYADQRALELGITIAGGADVIVLDEPTSGMSLGEIQRAVNLIREVSEGKTLMIVEHDMGVVFDIADTISVLVYGQVIASGSPNDIRGDEVVREAYLGTEH